MILDGSEFVDLAALKAIETLKEAIECAEDPRDIEMFVRALDLEEATATPAHLAMWCTAKLARPWQPYRWLTLLNRYLVALSERKFHRLMVAAPIRHGKSELGTKWFAAWYLGKHPDHRVVVGGHSTDFARGFGRQVRQIMLEFGPQLFGVQVDRLSWAADNWNLASPCYGGMQCVGVGNPPTGRGADLMVIDDPIRSAAQAYSAAHREAAWEWWRSGMRSRIEPGGVVSLIMSRWHELDLSGQLIGAQVKADATATDAPENPLGDDGEQPDDENEIDRFFLLRLPGLADPRPGLPDPLGRRPGEALCAERYSESRLRSMRDAPGGMGVRAFQALVQNDPKPEEGILFKAESWRWVAKAPDKLIWTRWWDLAATESDDADWTAGILAAKSPSGYLYLADPVRFRAEPHVVNRRLVRQAQFDAEKWGCRRTRIPQDPGQAGKAQARYLTRTVMAGLGDVKTIVLSGDKVARATPLADQQTSGWVVLVAPNGAAEWSDFRAECEGFPRGRHDDWVDAAAAAYLDLSGLLRHFASIPKSAPDVSA